MSAHSLCDKIIPNASVQAQADGPEWNPKNRQGSTTIGATKAIARTEKNGGKVGGGVFIG
jgi:hypothetical protein